MSRNCVVVTLAQVVLRELVAAAEEEAKADDAHDRSKSGKVHVTRHTSQVTRHTSHVTRHS